MDAQVKCPYCKEEFVIAAFAGPKDLKGSPNQTCPHCKANIDTRLLLSLMAGGFGARTPVPVRSLHAK